MICKNENVCLRDFVFLRTFSACQNMPLQWKYSCCLSVIFSEFRLYATIVLTMTDTSGCFDRISVCVGWPINEEVQDNFLETYLFDKAKPFLCIFIGKCKKSMPDYDMNRHRCALRSCAWRILPDKREAFAVIIAGERTDFLRSYKYRMPVWFLKSNKNNMFSAERGLASAYFY